MFVSYLVTRSEGSQFASEAYSTKCNQETGRQWLQTWETCSSANERRRLWLGWAPRRHMNTVVREWCHVVFNDESRHMFNRAERFHGDCIEGIGGSCDVTTTTTVNEPRGSA